MTDPDTRLKPHHGAAPDIRLGEFITCMFHRLSRLFFIGWEGPKSIAKLDGEPLDPFLVLHLSDKAERPQDSVTQGELSTSHAGTCTKRFLKSSAIFLALRLIGLRPK